MARLRQPFTKKKFVEDIMKPAFDFKKDKAADKLPKINYGTIKTNQEHSSMSPRNRSLQVIRKLELQTLYNKEHEHANYQSSQSILLQENDNASKSHHYYGGSGMNSSNRATIAGASGQRRIPIMVNDKPVDPDNYS